MDDLKFYMAGPIQHAQDRGKGWRARLKEDMDSVEWLDPLAAYDSTEEAREWESEEIIEKDLSMIDESDGLLVHWELVPTCGTPMEIRYAHQQNLPISVQTTVAPDDLSPWLTYHVMSISDSFAQAANSLKRYYD